jgi:F-type H+-transporting ATPase subunit epsilon
VPDNRKAASKAGDGMANSINLEIITPERLFYEGDVELVIVRTLTGDEGFMANHAWACKLLATGELWIQEKGSTGFRIAAISGGYIDVQKNIVIFTDSAEWPEEIDEARAHIAKERAENSLKIEMKDSIDIELAKIAIEKALTRIHVKGGGYRRKR